MKLITVGMFDLDTEFGKWLMERNERLCGIVKIDIISSDLLLMLHKEYLTENGTLPAPSPRED